MKLPNKVTLVLMLYLIPQGYINNSYGQCTTYQALLPYEKENKNLELQITSRMDKDLDRVNSYPKSIQTEISDLLKSRKSYIEEINKNKLIVCDSAFIAYYQNILNNILKANPYLDQNIKIYATRILEPNAFNIGDGNIYFNISLVRFMQNESQIAFIIAHELAHQYKEHVLESNINNYLKLKSQEMQTQIKKASKQEYGSKKALLEISKSLLFHTNKHSRFKETEADSLAIVFLEKTKYNPKEAISTLNILDKIDNYFEEFPHFVFTEYFKDLPINKRKEWDNYDVDTTFLSAVDKKVELNDSLKTHPDCKQRILSLETSFPFLKTAPFSHKTDDSAYKYIQSQATVEYINSIILYRDYGFSFNELILILKEDSTNCTIKLLLTRTMAEINYAQRTRMLGEILDIPSFTYPVQYNYVLSFLNELKLIESGSISYFLFKKLPEDLENEEYIYTAILSNYAYNKKEDANNFAAIYQTQFPKGKYISNIKSINFN